MTQNDQHLQQDHKNLKNYKKESQPDCKQGNGLICSQLGFIQI